MRGSPFTFSDLSRGVNVLDSPYTLKQGESRDCLNVVSTPRGAIKKRPGSLRFSGTAFPTLAVTDSFERADEKPLSNGGKWSALPEVVDTGQIESNRWHATVFQTSGAYWNVAEQTNPAISLEWVKGFASAEARTELHTCIQSAAHGKRYSLVAVGEPENPTELLASSFLLKISLAKDGVALTSPVTLGGTFPLKLGITVREGIVVGWVNTGSGWLRVVEAADTTYTKGFSGMQNHGAQPLFRNFSIGEMGASSNPAGTITRLLSCKTAGGNFLIVASGTKLYSVTEAGEVTEIGSGFTEGKRWSLVQAASGTRVALGPIYLSNGTDAPQSWTGAAKNTAVAEWTSKPEGEFVAVPKAKYLVYAGNRVWAGGLSEAGNEAAIRWSGLAAKAGEGNVADPTEWPKANIVWFDKDDGTPITGLGTVGSYLLVFKAHKTWVVFDLVEGENRRISGTTGCVSHRSIVETPMGTFFLSSDQGVFVTNGSKVQEMSRNVRPILQGTDPVSSRAAKQNQLESAAGAYLNGHYYLSYTAQDGSMKTLDYDTQLKSWWLHDLAGNHWAVWEPPTGSPQLYVVPNVAKTGVVRAFVPEVYRDSGSTYTGRKVEVEQHKEETITVTLTAYWSACWEPFWQYFMRHRFQQPQIKKRIRTLFLDAKGEVEGYAWRNFGTKPQRLKGVVENKDVATESTYTPKPGPPAVTSPEYQAVRFYSLGTGRVWSFMFANQTAEPFEVDTYACDLEFRKN